MRERPIIANGSMVRAILESRKTQTRRPIAIPRRGAFVLQDDGSGWWPYQSDDGESTACRDGVERPMACPFGQPGDHLWVRETWAKAGEVGDAVEYRADNPDPLGAKWRPSIHMPRWASRLALEVTKVRVQRLQDISEDDARAEGIADGRAMCGPQWSFRDGFSDLWDFIYGKRAPWSSNPWVWAVSFRVVKP